MLIIGCTILLGNQKLENEMYKKLKRVIDIIIASMGLIILSPLLAALCIAVKLDSKGEILFQQRRVGIHKKHFYILKFRTMQTNTPKDIPTHLLDYSDRYITKVGKILRKTSLDELPQLINILKGDMSIIGDNVILGTNALEASKIKGLRHF